MKGVRLLPQELGRAQEQTRPQLPAHDVVPQVEEHREVAIRLQPILDDLGDESFARAPDREPLVQLLATGVRHPRDLWIEALDVLRLLLEQAARNQQGEVD